ncbi:acyl-CoA dehydrogenase family protein [Variovorax sp. V213]|uniref:acyl-CoA dehydrogenase family protein n=1 Tax=Variovorax sp. V213 TaxID=3065955 RepID=UPI0034E87C58
MHEYAISRAYADARAERIAGGSSDVTKEIVARTLGLAREVTPLTTKTGALRSGRSNMTQDSEIRRPSLPVWRIMQDVPSYRYI